jgi:very-short-patch-repair endonuclease
MVTAKPLPEDLAKLPFTVYQARALGVAPKRLHAKDMVGAGRLIRAHAGRDVSLVDRARVLCAATPDAWVSHETAATFFDLGLPPWLGQEPGIHLSKPHGLPRVRRAGVVGHRVHVIPGEVVEIDGISVSGPPRTWLDLAHQLPLRYPNMKGVEKARLALDEMRVGSDSFPETFLRLALRDARLPEPELQLRLDPNNARSPAADLGYRKHRIAVQYDGAHHRSREQQSRDNRRDELFVHAGWSYFKPNADDLADGFQELIARIKRARRS